MTRSTEDAESGKRSSRLTSVTGGAASPFHFTLHKPGYHLESCCGICNLFPGVLLIAFAQVLLGSILLTLVLSHGDYYDEIHKTENTQFTSMGTGLVLSGITGAGFLLIIVALTENCRAMLIYLLVAAMSMTCLFSLAVAKIIFSCHRFRDALKVKTEEHDKSNLACVSGLMTFLFAVLYFFSFVVVFSFYHFRYVRRAILLHEAECCSSR